MLGLVRDKSIMVSPNDLNVFDMDVAPGVFWDSLNEFNLEQSCGWTVDKIEGKGFQITKKAATEEDTDLKVNVKFYGTVQ